MTDTPNTIVDEKVKRENLFLNLLFNLGLPIIALKQLSSDDRLGASFGLVVALAFPVAYFIYDLVQRRNYNIISIFGFMNILLTGSIGLLEAEPKWVVLKETAMPLLIAVMVMATANTKKSLLKTFLLNDQVFDIDRIESHINTPDKQREFEGHFKTANWLLVLSFTVSAALNFVLASSIVKSPGGTEAFNQEIATLTWVGWLVIAVPTLAISIFALWKLIRGMTKLTGLKFEELIHADHRGG